MEVPKLHGPRRLFGARHKYQRTADSLYSPPAYLYDETDPTYYRFLVNHSSVTGIGYNRPVPDAIGHDHLFKELLTTFFCEFLEAREMKGIF